MPNAGVRWNQAQMGRLENITTDRVVTDALLDAGERIAKRAAVLAPKRTGQGAASIHAELALEAWVGVHARVSWTRNHFYLRFHELGTSHQPAKPFLRPAAGVPLA